MDVDFRKHALLFALAIYSVESFRKKRFPSVTLEASKNGHKKFRASSEEPEKSINADSARMLTHPKMSPTELRRVVFRGKIFDLCSTTADVQHVAYLTNETIAHAQHFLVTDEDAAAECVQLLSECLEKCSDSVAEALTPVFATACNKCIIRLDDPQKDLMGAKRSQNVLIGWASAFCAFFFSAEQFTAGGEVSADHLSSLQMQNIAVLVMQMMETIVSCKMNAATDVLMPALAQLATQPMKIVSGPLIKRYALKIIEQTAKDF